MSHASGYKTDTFWMPHCLLTSLVPRPLIRTRKTLWPVMSHASGYKTDTFWMPYCLLTSLVPRPLIRTRKTLWPKNEVDCRCESCAQNQTWVRYFQGTTDCRVDHKAYQDWTMDCATCTVLYTLSEWVMGPQRLVCRWRNQYCFVWSRKWVCLVCHGIVWGNNSLSTLASCLQCFFSVMSRVVVNF